jgi:hypothetical protein
MTDRSFARKRQSDPGIQTDARFAPGTLRRWAGRLNYVKGSITVYRRSIRRLFQLMKQQGVALGDLTPEAVTLIQSGATSEGAA